MTTAQQVIDAIRAIAPCSRSAWTPKAVNESASVIQQAITEAVDAAVASQKARYDALARKWQQDGREWEAECDRRWYICDEHASELLAEGEK